ncbi:helix-turn-helix domain-containing protein [Alkalihalobacillus sp. TS-13]|uniref:helix-turn-helix domain-containing protein n=1 Tax=Alkalihalobacillus sp. TS-13 TaxID=2842455 RepID=UPI001C88A693|nr:helix-turn-helix domain-containing protein [Alkalihalobacillus sp. TS-13]
MKDMDLYGSVQKAKKKNDRSSIQHILERLEPKIKQTVISMERRYQEDVEQEVKLRVMEAVRGYDTDHLPTLKELLEKTKEGQAVLEKLKNDKC